MSLVLTLALWLVVAVLALAIAARGGAHLRGAARQGLVDFLHLLPRIAIGVIGAGYIAALMPADVVAAWLGPDSGMGGVVLATLAGAATPGGPVIGFSVATAALKAGAGAPQVVAYSIAWALFAVHRLVIFEIPLMPARVVWLRAVVSIPLPLMAALGAMLIGRP
ncbi:MAG: hypothetical protein M5U07_20180 [Xanthobacteraceae bacterium]|nr:hypothetical protein [Xanthobacteraceae bacterium]